jgi:hypothetical protein
MSAGEDLGADKACAHASDEDDVGKRHGAVLGCGLVFEREICIAQVKFAGLR